MLRVYKRYVLLKFFLGAAFCLMLGVSVFAANEPDDGNFIDGSFSVEGKIKKDLAARPPLPSGDDFMDAVAQAAAESPLTNWEVTGNAALGYLEDNPLAELKPTAGTFTQIGQLVLFNEKHPVVEFDILGVKAAPGDKLEIYIQELGGPAWGKPEAVPVLLGSIDLSSIEVPQHVEVTKAATLFPPLKDKVDSQNPASGTMLFRLIAAQQSSFVQLDNFSISYRE